MRLFSGVFCVVFLEPLSSPDLLIKAGGQETKGLPDDDSIEALAALKRKCQSATVCQKWLSVFLSLFSRLLCETQDD